MKKILVSALFIALCASQANASDIYENRYQVTTTQKTEFKKQPETTRVTDSIFANNDDNFKDITTSAMQTVQKPVTVTKELKQKYKDITKDEKIIQACELLKGSVGDFSYNSIHGKNQTNKPVEIVFENLTKDKKHANSYAFGEFSGKKYKIVLNSKYQDAPPEALAPLLAREALISRDKTEDDIEEAEQLQIAVWSQMLSKNPSLEDSNNSLVKIQNELKANANVQDYGSFFSEESKKEKKPPEKPKTKEKKSKMRGKAAQENFDFDKQEEGEKIAAEIISFDSKALEKRYKKVTKEDRIMEALDLLKDSVGKFSHDAILGNNVTHRPISIKFKNLGEINPKYASFDALGWRQAGKLNIFINSKHADAPAGALAAILAHEALHQDEYDSLNEETYAWTMEASVWTQMCDKNPEIEEITHPLVTRENMLKKLLEKGNYSNKYIKKSVFSNPSYSNLPVRSPGFEEDI